jgi:hypothetical protein
MEDQFRYRGNHVGAEREANQMRVCRLLLQRLMKEDYTTPYDERNQPHFDWFRKKMEESFKKPPNEKGYITITAENEPDEPDGGWILLAHKHEEYLGQQDLNLLCSIINKHVKKWWD